MIKSYFKNIENELIKVLNSAKTEIKVAVCWFTNPKLFNILCEKQRNNIPVSLIVLNDAINNRRAGLNFQRFIDLGGAFYFGSVDAPMHNKYCIIDNKTVVTGSYNWTYFAESKNFENITIIENTETVEDYLENFTYLTNEKCMRVTDVEAVANTKDSSYAVEETNLNTEYDIPLIPFLSVSIGIDLYPDKYCIVLKENTELPATSKHTSTTVEDNQTGVRTNIRYGTHEQGSKNTAIGSFDVYNLPELPAGEVNLDKTFEVDTEGILTLKVVVRETGKVTERTFNIKHLVGYRKS